MESMPRARCVPMFIQQLQLWLQLQLKLFSFKMSVLFGLLGVHPLAEQSTQLSLHKDVMYIAFYICFKKAKPIGI